MKNQIRWQWLSSIPLSVRPIGISMVLIGIIMFGVQVVGAEEMLDQENAPIWGGDAMNILTSNEVGQSFQPSCQDLSRVDVDLIYQGGAGSVTAIVLRNGLPIPGAHAQTLISQTGWVQLPLDSIVSVTPGETLVLRLESDTYPLPLWKYDGDTYPLGTRLFFGSTQIGDFFFRTYSTSCQIQIILPIGGEVIPSGGIYGICWEAPSYAVKFDLYYSTDNGTNWNFIESVTGLNCTHWEEIPVVTANKKKCLVKVVGYDSANVSVGADVSDKPFTIEVVRVTSPYGGQTLESGSTWAIRWVTNKTVRPVANTVLKYTTDGTTWKPIKTLTGNPGIYNWKVPAESSTKCKVKVILKDAGGVNIGTDVSDKVFTVQP